MKNILLSFFFVFYFFIPKINAQFIDELELVPIEFTLYSASNNFLNKFSTGEKTWIYSNSVDVKLNKFVHPNILFQLGLRYQAMRYRLNFWAGSMEDVFLYLRNEEVSVPIGMEDLVVRRVRFQDKYLTIPIGGKYFLSSSAEGFNLYLSGYYQPSFLINDNVNTEIAIKGGFLLPTYMAVQNSEFEPFIDQYFETRKEFISSFQLGVGGNVKVSEKFRLGAEIQWTRIVGSIHESILENQNGIGVKFIVSYLFSKRDK